MDSTRLQDLPLSGRRVVVTRPTGQAESLCGAIARLGGEAIRFPVIEIAALEDAAGLQAATASLQDYDLAFFVSPNAVAHALDFILPRRAWPAHTVVATVGKGSEGALARRGFRNVVAPDQGFDSEAVLSLPAFAEAAVRGRRVVIFRGDGGRDLLGETLLARGAAVDYVSCYRRRVPQCSPASLIADAADGRLHALVLTSSEGVGNFVTMVGEQGLAVLAGVCVIAPHARIAAAAEAAGFRRVICCDAGDDGVLAALLRDAAG